MKPPILNHKRTRKILKELTTELCAKPTCINKVLLSFNIISTASTAFSKSLSLLSDIISMMKSAHYLGNQ